MGDAGECSIGRGRGSGCFMRPLTFTSPAFQSAVSIKDGCSSYVFPIHQRPRDIEAPLTDSSIWWRERKSASGRGGVRESANIEKWRRKRMREKGHRNAAENAVLAREWQRKTAFKYKQNGRRRLPRKELKQHFVSEYALFKVGYCPLAGTV